MAKEEEKWVSLHRAQLRGENREQRTLPMAVGGVLS